MRERNLNSQHMPPSGPASAGEIPLESWKEIAVFLQRDVRTVTRWEKHEGLPVHRHHHLSRSSVYAYPSELDAWRAAREREMRAEPVPLWRRPLPLTALAGLVLLSLITVGNGPFSGRVMAAGITTRQVWAGPGVYAAALYGGVSYDGRYLSYGNGATGDLAVRDLRSGESRNLTKHSPGADPRDYAESSVPSRDGTQVAYAWYVHSNGYSLRVVGLDGSEPRILIPQGRGWLRLWDWSPDGRHILTALESAERGGKPQIALVSAADGAVRVLKTLDGEWQWPARLSFSPGGRYIAYDSSPRQGAVDRDIFVLAADGTGETPLIKHPADDFVIGWTPDGSGVLFSSNRTGNRSAWLIRVPEGRPQGVPVMVKPDLPEQLTPLGFTQDGACYYGVRTPRRDVYVATLDPETGKVLAQPSQASVQLAGGYTRYLDWSPDGQYLAYIFREWWPTILSVHDLQTREERQIRLWFGVHPRRSALRWSPDGRSFLVLGGGGNRRVCRVNAQTGETAVILEREPGEGGFLSPEWSPDGRTFFYSHSDSIFIRDLNTGEEKQLHRSPGRIGPLAVSPDGGQLAFVSPRGKGDRALMLMPTAGGEPRELHRGLIFCPTWTPDGRYVIFVVAHEQNTGEVWRIPAEGGEAQKLGVAMKRLADIRVHPDGRRIAFTAVPAGVPEWSGEIWVMENFLRELRGAE